MKEKFHSSSGGSLAVSRLCGSRNGNKYRNGAGGGSRRYSDSGIAGLSKYDRNRGR